VLGTGDDFQGPTLKTAQHIPKWWKRDAFSVGEAVGL